MQVSDFYFDLPNELIAQRPLVDRAASRLLRVERSAEAGGGPPEERIFGCFPDLLSPDDLVVFNNTRVFPARLYGRRSGVRSPRGGAEVPAYGHLPGQVEVLLTKQIAHDPNEWECLVRPGRKVGIGEKVVFFDQVDLNQLGHGRNEGKGELRAEIISRGSFGERRIRFAPVADFFGTLERLGHVPLPPYITREDDSEDRARYQTVYASAQGSVAAPTAGLHFTPEILARLHERGIETAEITLHVGLGTFQPVRVERVEDHKLHGEKYAISVEAAEKINVALAAGRRVVAVGTTTVRTLEYAALLSGAKRVEAGSGEANLFIYPGFRFRVVGAMLTNFHLPESTLLMLVCAFGGQENILKAYRHAVEQEYRFYSYGDCMFVE